MNIKREVEEKSIVPLTIDDVEDGQLFISEPGWLCQKLSAYQYVVIADLDGNTLGILHDVDDTVKIVDRLPKVLALQVLDL